MRPAPLLVLPCESRAREFDAKLLLAGVAAERGFPVRIGSKKEIHKQLHSLPHPSIYLAKSLTRRSRFVYEVLRRQGHTVVCGDEEALVYPSAESYLANKVCAQTLRRADALLAWGPENARVWQLHEAAAGVPVHLTGNVRFDLLRPELRDCFGPQACAIRERFGRYLLVNTNFSRINHFSPGQSRQRRALEGARMGSSGESELGFAAHKAALFARFREMLPALASAFPSLRVVVRPHPSERIESWRAVTRDLPNTDVVFEGSAVPWILAADALIHNGCTTAIEATLLGKPAIAYRPVVSERWDLALPNAMGHRADDLDALMACARRAARGELECAGSAVLGRHLSARTGPLAAERIVTALEGLLREGVCSRRPPRGARELSRTAAWLRSALQRIEAYWPGHHNHAAFLRHAFPDLSRDTVRSRLAEIGGVLGRFEKLEVRQRSLNVFEIVT